VPDATRDSKQFADQFLSRTKQFSHAAGAFVILMGLVALAGWAFDIFRLKALYAGITLKANTALCLSLAGTSLWLLNIKTKRNFLRSVANTFSATIAIVGFLTLTEHLIGWNLGIDQLLFTEPPGALDTTSPGRMGPPAATCFTLAGISLLLLHQRRAIRFSQLLAILVGLWALLAVVGYTYNAHAFYNIAKYTGIALPTAVSLFALSLGLLTARIDQGLTAVISTERASGIMARRLLFMTLTVPFLLGWLRLIGERNGYYDLGFGTATLILTIIIIFVTLIWLSAAKLSSTEQKQLAAELIVSKQEEGLRRQLRFDEAVMTNMGEGLFTVNDQGLLTFMNPAAERLFGWSLAELRGGKMHDATHYQHRDGTPFPIEECAGFQVLHQRSTLVNQEDVFIRRDGTFFDVVYSSSPIWEGNKTSGVVVVFRDVTERKLAEERLRESERLQRLLAQIGELAPQMTDTSKLIKTITEQVALTLGVARCGYSTVDVHTGEINVLNDFHGELPSFAGKYRLVDYAQHLMEDGLAGRISAVEDLTADPRLAGLYNKRQKLIGVASHINVPLHRGGKWVANFWISHHEPRNWSLSEIQLTRVIADRLWLLVERKEAEEERELLLGREQAAREQAETANRMKDEFLTTVSHELRTPLSAILGWSSMLASGRLNASESERAVQAIERNARAQAQIVEDILDVSRTVSGKLRLDIRPIELISVIKAAIDSIRPAAEAKEIQLELLLDPAADRINADATRMQQVVWNLLANAVKFSPNGGHVQVKLQRAGPMAQIKIIDEGEGISAEFLPKVFNRFQQADGSMTRRHGGLGLGLAIARHLVEMHGGTIEVSSDGLARGATFTVKLAAARSVVPVVEPDKKPPVTNENPSSLSDLRILVIDDEADTRNMIGTFLENNGAKVLTAASAKQGLEVLSGWKPHVLICDIGMPEEDGYGFIRAVRARESGSGGNTPAIALTGYVRIEERMRALDAGYQMFVPKPIEMNELSSLIISLVQSTSSV